MFVNIDLQRLIPIFLGDGQIFFITPYSPELNIIEIFWKHIKYYWLDFKAFDNYIALFDKLHKILSSFGSKYVINFK